MPVVNVHCVRHNTCHVTYTVTSPMCTRAERLTRAVESLAVHMGIDSAGPVYEVRRPNFHGIISGLEGLIAVIKSEECKLNR